MIGLNLDLFKISESVVSVLFTLGPFLASTWSPLPRRTITRISVAAQPIAYEYDIQCFNHSVLHSREKEWGISEEKTRNRSVVTAMISFSHLHYRMFSQQLQNWRCQCAAVAARKEADDFDQWGKAALVCADQSQASVCYQDHDWSTYPALWHTDYLTMDNMCECICVDNLLWALNSSFTSTRGEWGNQG